MASASRDELNSSHGAVSIPLNGGVVAMGKSRRLRLADVRAAMRLVGECRDLGYDPALWLRRAFEGLCGLVGARIVLGGEVRWARPAGPIVPRLGMHAGLTPAEERKYLGYF